MGMSFNIPNDDVAIKNVSIIFYKKMVSAIKFFDGRFLNNICLFFLMFLGPKIKSEYIIITPKNRNNH